jgi:2-methylcitrate dehydratase PrpD
MGVTETVAQYVASANFDELPPEVIELSKRLILDTVGVTLAGLNQPVGRIIDTFVRELEGRAEARVLGSGFRTSSAQAAFANGVMCHALDYDDSWYWPAGHPSSTVVPVVLALGEKHRLSGQQAIMAHVLGLEVHGQIGAGAERSSPGETGWHGVGSFGTLGAVSAAAHLLELDLRKTIMAFGIGASQAAGLAANAGTMTKPFHAGNSAKNGIVAAMLAKQGFTAHYEIIESVWGFAENFIGPGNYDLDKMAPHLGTSYYMLSPGVLLKRYPSCYSNQWVLQEALELVREHDFSHEEVEDIELGAPTEGVVLDIPEPATGLMAKFSWQFSIAASIVDGRIGIDTYDDDKVADPRIKDVMAKVKLVPNPGRPRDNVFPLTIKLKDGRKCSSFVEYPKGHCQNPFTDEELAEKYRECAEPVLSAEQIERSIDTMLDLEKVDDLTELVDLLTGEVTA